MSGFPGPPSYDQVLARQLREEREANRTEPEPVQRTADADDLCDALWCEEKSKSMTFYAEIDRLRAELAQRTAALDQMTVHRNAAIEHRDITQQVLNGITVALSQRTAELAKANAERDEAREDLDRTQRVLVKIDAVRTHQSEKLVRVYEASGAEPQHFDCIDKFVGMMRVAFAAIESMGYEWRWTRSIDENGEQVGAWVMHDAAEADANNERFRRTDGE